MWFSFYGLPEHKNIFMSWEVSCMSSNCLVRDLTTEQQGNREDKIKSLINTPLLQGTMVTSDVVYFYCYHQTGGLLKGSDLKDQEGEKIRAVWASCNLALTLQSTSGFEKNLPYNHFTPILTKHTCTWPAHPPASVSLFCGKPKV